MKDGDQFLLKLIQAQERVIALRNWFLAISSVEYQPDWLYWLEYGRSNIS